MDDISTNLPINQWAEDDRPREKLLLKGTSALSDAELIAILIGSGSRNESAVQLSQRILQKVNNNLNELGRMNLKSLMEFKGIGEAKAITITAALELGRRRQGEAPEEKPKILSSKQAFNIFQPMIGDRPHEEFCVAYLNRSHRLISAESISTGGIAGTVVDIKMIAKRSVELLASAVMFCHNHPSGNLQPSDADKQLTKKSKESLALLDVVLIDHLIVSHHPEQYYSFADEGVIL